MIRKFKIIIVLLLTLSFGGCASTSDRGPVLDFVDGAESNHLKRQERQSARGDVPDNKFKEEDAVAGVFNALLQGLVGIFSSDEKD